MTTDLTKEAISASDPSYPKLFASDSIDDWTQPPAPDDPDCFDPYCDYEKPRTIRFEDITAAAYRIRGGIYETPCEWTTISQDLSYDVYLKKDFLQFSGSFKERGARNALLCLTKEERALGAIAASAGNHASALAYHGKLLGIPIAVVMPVVAPLVKITTCKSYGATVIVKGNGMGEAKRYALKYGKRKCMKYINGYDHPHILSGQGTCGLEILEQMAMLAPTGSEECAIDAVCVPVGGGGLIAGIALAIKHLSPHVKIFACESERAAGWNQATIAGKPTSSPVYSTLADGLAVPLVGCNSFATAAPLVDATIVVREEFIALAILRLLEREKAIVEGAGATAFAAILSGELDNYLKPEASGRRKRVVAVVSGGNIDITCLGRVLQRGMAADGRLTQFTLTISDRPGGAADLTKLLAECGATVKDMFHERAFSNKADVYSTQVRIIVETFDVEHTQRVEAALRATYRDVHRGGLAGT